MKHLIAFLSLLLFVACENPIHESCSGYTLQVNNPHTITLNRHEWQTIDFIHGNITDCNGDGIEGVRFEWKSNLWWTIGDTLGYLVEFGLTDDLEWRNYDTTYITWFKGHEVPTINPASYSDSDGDFTIQIAPIRIMKGDTLKVWYECYKDRTFLSSDSLIIFLE